MYCGLSAERGGIVKKSIKYILTLFILVLCVLQVNACGVINKTVDKGNKSKKEVVDEDDVEEEDAEEEDVDKKETKKKKSEKEKKKQKNESSETALTKEIQSNTKPAPSNSLSEADYSKYYNQIDYAASEIDPTSYIFPDSDKRVLSNAEIEAASIWQLRRGTNEVYARHGRKFKNQGQAAYFESKSWYNGTIEADNFNESTLNEYEKQNVKLMQNRLDSLIGNNDISSLELRACKFVGEKGVNGLLRCEFSPDNVKGISPYEIVYQLTDESIDYGKVIEELAKTGASDFDLDTSYLSKDSLDQFFKKYIAYPVELTVKCDVYVDGKGVYCLQHGDTNHMMVDHLELVDVKDDVVTFVYLDYSYYGGVFPNLIISLQKNGESFKFVSVSNKFYDK